MIWIIYVLVIAVLYFYIDCFLFDYEIEVMKHQRLIKEDPDRYSYIIKVIESCINFEQLVTTSRWAFSQCPPSLNTHVLLKTMEQTEVINRGDNTPRPDADILKFERKHDDPK